MIFKYEINAHAGVVKTEFRNILEYVLRIGLLESYLAPGIRYAKVHRETFVITHENWVGFDKFFSNILGVYMFLLFQSYVAQYEFDYAAPYNLS